MPASYKKFFIDTYEINHHAIGVTTAVNRIWCSSSSDTGQGIICFYPKGQVPASAMSSENFFNLNYEADRYPEIIETLRYEKPVYAHISWDAHQIITCGYISTGSEPVCEQEGSGLPHAS